ncbi:MAG: hypothetical protein AB3N16_03415 [Flavobacteriaceae bacterium]
MRALYGGFLLFLLGSGALSCRTDKGSEKKISDRQESILTKVAYAHGFEQWSKVQSIQFTFNVDRDTSHFERRWLWWPKTNQVSTITGNDTLTYNRRQLDSTLHKTNAGFINDKFWLLMPFQLLWDQENFTYQYFPKKMAPISGDTLNKLTIVYDSIGGYTPGDAYDLYLDDTYSLREWTFRKGNRSQPSLNTTWEAYRETNGMKIATEHQNLEGFRLYFTNLKID